MSERAAIAWLLAVATLAVYGQAVGFEFLSWDDSHYLIENPQLGRGLGLETLRWALTTRYFDNWHPLTWLSYALDRALFGLEPAGYHAVNVALHAANALLLFAVFERMTGSPRRSGFAAALFALHPLHAESVAWVSERKDVLSLFFGLLALGAYAGFARRGGALRYALVTGLLALGLMAKPVLVTLPLLFLLLDGWPLGRIGRAGSALRLAAEKLPWLALAAASAVMTLAAQRRLPGDVDTIPLDRRLANAAVSSVDYLAQTFWPTGLACYYPHPYLPGGTPPGGLRIAGAVALLGALSAAALHFRRTGYAPVGWLWYLVSLAPVIGIVQVGAQARADRYTYLPLIGIFLLVTWGAGDGLAILARRWPGLRRAAALGALALLVLLALVSRAQVATWRDSVTLFRHALASTGPNWVIEYNLANALQERRETAEAIAHYRAALEIAPHRADVRFNLGQALGSAGQDGAAEEQFRAALALEPRHPKAHLSLGRLLLARGELAAAIQELRRAARASPRSWVARYDLALALARSGEPRLALAQFEAAARLADDPTRVRSEWAWLLATHPWHEVRDGAAAAALVEEAAGRPGAAQAHALAALAAARAETGDYAGAVAAAERALALARSEGGPGFEQRVGRALERFRASQPAREDPGEAGATR